MARHDIYCKCGPCRKRRSILGDTQTLTNRTQVVPTQPISNYEWEKNMGFISEDMTPEEYVNRPVNTSLEVTEYGENV